MTENNENIALDVVNKQLDAYNNHNYEVFASCYHKEIISFDLNTSEKYEEMSGSSFFKHYFDKFQENPKIHCAVIERIVDGNLVIDKERISNFQGTGHNELVIYQVNDGLITKMWYKR